MTAQLDQASLLMKEGCPVDLSNPIALYERLKSYLNGLGQADGYWTIPGECAIPLTYVDCLLARKLQEDVNPKFVVRVSTYLADNFSEYASEISHMCRAFGFEFANGWRIFPVVTDEAEGVTEWFIAGMLFPRYDGTYEGWAIFAHLSEVFG